MFDPIVLANHIADQENLEWDTESMLGLLGDFISENCDKRDFVAFMKKAAQIRDNLDTGSIDDEIDEEMGDLIDEDEDEDSFSDLDE